MERLLQECRHRFGHAPREFSFWDRLTYFRVSKPAWLMVDRSDDLLILFKNMKQLFTEGTVVWGQIIQANQLMFRDGNQNCPGELIYSTDDARSVDPLALQKIAHQLYELKGTIPDDPQLLPIADYLTDEMTRVFGLKVPRSISPSLRCRISTTFFVRKHLPNRRLCTALMPIVVRRRKPFVAMPLPVRFWPDELVDLLTQ